MIVMMTLWQFSCLNLGVHSAHFNVFFFNKVYFLHLSITDYVIKSTFLQAFLDTRGEHNLLEKPLKLRAL
jgi:hypothetical protein